MNQRKIRIDVEWGHLLLLAAFATFVVWYYGDAQSASTEIENTVLILPASIVALVLSAVVAIQSVHIRKADATAPEEPVADRKKLLDEILSPLLFIATLGAYVLSITTIGFDVATTLFLAVGMLICGERRPLVILAFSVLFSAFCVYSLKLVLPLDFPTLLF